MFLMYIHDPIR